MTDDEKILRFAGFTEVWEESDGQWWGLGPKKRYKDGRQIISDTADLTWLFKWCVPKVLEKLGREEFHKFLHGWLFEGTLQGIPTGQALRAAIVALIGEGDE